MDDFANIGIIGNGCYSKGAVMVHLWVCCAKNNLSNLLEKIHQKREIHFAHDGNPLGYCTFYANDAERRIAYISLIAVLPEYQKLHIGTKLLKESFEIMRTYGMEHCMLEVRKNNRNAIRFYEKNYFVIIEEREESYLMRCEL